MKRWMTPAAVAAIALLTGMPSAHAADKTILTVYTALEPDQLRLYKEAFEKSNPDVAVRWARDSTGVVTSKLLAEKSNPKADVVMGLAASSLALLKQQGMLLPYEPKGFKSLKPKFSDTQRPPSWVGMDVWASTICFNTAEAAKRKIPKPESWKDLEKPIYKGQIVMPDPVSSGTGYLDVTGWMQMFGEADAWKFMDALHQNVLHYTESGSKPCRQAGAGEVVVGISFEYRALQVKASGAPIDLVFPKEGLGWDIEATGIMKSTKHLEAAKKLADWSASKEANELYQRSFVVVVHSDVHKPDPSMPTNYESMLVKNDFDSMATNRERVLAEWAKRYASKDEKE